MYFSPPYTKRSQPRIRDNLEFLWFLMRGTMNGGGGEQTDIVSMLPLFHERVDKRRRRRSSRRLIFQRHNHVKPAASNNQATFFGQLHRRAFKRNLSVPKSCNGFRGRKAV